MNDHPNELETSAPVAQVTHELAELEHGWWWFLLLGFLLVACGVVALVYPFVSSVGIVIVFGATLMIAGLATIISSFFTGNWSAFLLQLLVGILYVVIGQAITDAPVESTVVLTLLVASFLIVVGVFRIVAALVLKFPQWGWALVNGFVTLLLGVVIYRHFSASALWLIGTFVGIEMILNGWTWIMLAYSLKSISADVE